MEKKIVTVIKWLFLVIGVCLLLVAASTKHEGLFSLILIMFGIIFTLIGGGMILFSWWKSMADKDLRKNGQLISAEFQQVELNEAFDVNGKHPFRIIAQWHDTGKNQLHIFKSPNIWFDPSPFIQSGSIPVYIDRNKPNRYSVDLSFLPNVIE